MPDLKLQAVLDATSPEALPALLAPFLDGLTAAIEVEAQRVQPPLCYWLLARAGDRRITVKVFFRETDFASYAAQLIELHGSDSGRFVLVAALNAVIWAWPFDPAMPALDRCADGGWVASTVGWPEDTVLIPETVAYNPEVGASFVYRDAGSGKVRLAAATAPGANCGLQWLVMERLRHAATQTAGAFKVARPLAFRREPALLVHAPLPGRVVQAGRNSRAFLDVAMRAGRALAAIHAADAPFGPIRTIGDEVARLEAVGPELALLAPDQVRTYRLLLERLRSGAETEVPPVPMPSHGSYTWWRLRTTPRSVYVTDFDRFGQAEPGLDVGTFCAHLAVADPEDWREAAAVELVRTEFLQTYVAYATWALDLPRMCLFEGAALAERALSHIWGQQPGWELRAGQLLDLALDRVVAGRLLGLPGTALAS